MRNYVILLRKPFLIAATIAMVITLLLAAETRFKKVSNASASSLPQDRQVIVKSLARDLQVVEFKQTGKSVNIVLKNNYNKNITAYAISSYDAVNKREGVQHRMDFIFADDLKIRHMSPGSTRVFEGDVAGPVTIRAVVFEDKTSDGDQNFVKEIFDRRRGVKVQMERFHQYLKKMAQTLNQDVLNEMRKPKMELGFRRFKLEPEISRLKDFVASLPEKPDVKESTTFETALKTAKHDVNEHVKEIERYVQTDDLRGFWNRLNEIEERRRILCGRL